MSRQTVTLIIHGTFAANSKWWQLGDGLFADRLEKALTRHGIQGTVWYPALEAGFAYADFAWSGRNEHQERIKAAVEMAPKINSLAERLGCTIDEPMIVHLVGHSHGGNVILEILKRLDSRVSPGKIVLLGTPLLRVVPAFRLPRLLFASILTFLATLVITLSLLSLVALPIMMFWEHLRVYVLYIALGLGFGYLLTVFFEQRLRPGPRIARLSMVGALSALLDLEKATVHTALWTSAKRYFSMP